MATSVAEFNENLALYYKKYFPSQLIYNWLNYKNSKKNDCFKFREFSYTLQGDIYIRYQAFENASEFRYALLQKNPIKIDIGAVYNISPKLARAYPHDFKPLERELVFDIDISDYDDVRNCCKESDICKKCWPFMKIGAKILKTVLEKEFSFTKLLFVFSGRRGFHCWVCDKKARELGPEARRAICDYFAVVTGGQSVVKRVTLNTNQGIHPMINKALEVIDEDFEDLMINKQDFLADDQLVQNVLDLIEDDKFLQETLKKNCKFDNGRLSSAEKWSMMVQLCSKYKPKKAKASYFIQEVKLQHCFPRLDSNVTRGFNHLLKLPFCIHPKTENLCVPLDKDDLDSFDLSKVPKVGNLSPEIMDPYIKVMKKFVDTLDN